MSKPLEIKPTHGYLELMDQLPHLEPVRIFAYRGDLRRNKTLEILEKEGYRCVLGSADPYYKPHPPHGLVTLDIYRH
jgi:hypothetical protein